jgi:hypothetical protein
MEVRTSETDGNVKFLSFVENRYSFYCGSDAFCDTYQCADLAVGNEKDELFTPEPGQYILTPDKVFQDPPQFNQHYVPRQVTVGIVEQLEVIDIHQDDAQALAPPPVFPEKKKKKKKIKKFKYRKKKNKRNKNKKN